MSTSRAMSDDEDKLQLEDAIRDLEQEKDPFLRQKKEMNIKVDQAKDTLQHQINSLVVMQQDANQRFDQYAIDMQTLSNIKFNKDFVGLFWQRPYAVVPKKIERKGNKKSFAESNNDDNQYYVIVPKFVDFGVGWLEKSVKGWNYFVVNRYAQWLGDIPRELQGKFHFKERLPLTIQDGILHTQDVETREKAWQRYSKHLHSREGADKIKIKVGHEFDLADDLIMDGIMPMPAAPIKQADMRFDFDPGITLRDYQDRSWMKFLEYGNVGVFWPPGGGKTVIGVKGLAHLRGPKFVVAPSIFLLDQWREKLKLEYHFPQSYIDEILFTTYHGYDKLKNKKWMFGIFDEAHRLPANTFYKMATVDCVYRMGLSATPYREDGRTDLIFTLTGMPTGMNWQEIIDAGLIKRPRILIYVVDDYAEKYAKIEELILDDKKTLIYSYWLEYGDKLSQKFNIPFVHSGVKNGYQTMKNSPMFVMSSVGTEGIDLPDLERVIEFSFQFGSRREEAQLLGRLLHSQKDETEHIILFTEEESERYEKRLYSLYEKNFRVEWVR